MAHGFTVQGGLGAVGSIIPHESSAHSVLVPDAELLFTAQFHRAGPDLVLTGRDGANHLIPGYFESEHRPALVAPNGAHLSPDTVDLLAGSLTPGHYAQAQPAAPPDSIGKIEKVVGDVTVVRNGVAVALHVGDAVFKSDVVQTGASASCGISFPDGTALNLVANTRMALNDYSYDANSNGNGALFTLVEGTFAFVAGKVAHSGDMKIATPVATMGIRGTTGIVEEQPNPPGTITATAADHTYTFAVVPDFGTGITGMWDVFLTDANGVIQRDANGNPIVLVTVSQSGYVSYLTPQGFGQPPLVETLQVTNLQFAFQTRILRDLADTLNLGNQNNGGNNGSSTPPPYQLPNLSPQLHDDNATPTIIKDVVDAGSAPATSTNDPARPNTPTQTAHWQYASDGNWNNPLDWSDGFAPFSWQNIVIGLPATVTIDSATGDSGPTPTVVNNLTIDAGATLAIVSGGSLVVSGTLDDLGLVKVNSTGADPTLTLNGPVIVEVGGEIEALGSLATVYFAADTVDNFGKILADNYGQVFFESGTTVTNEVGGQIEATDYGIVTFDQISVDNFGTIGANDYGQFFFEPGTTVTNEVGGLIVAESNGAVLLDTGETVKNFGTLEAATGGTLTLDDNVANQGQVLVQDGGTVVLVNDTITGGQINLSSTGSATDLEIAGVVTLTGGTVTLSDNAQNAIVSNGAAAELINYDSISGAGTIGDGNLTLDNFATIDATDALPLILDTGANAIINEAVTGILEASWRGTLDIESDLTNEGQVIAQHGGTVGLVGAVITGGIVTVDGVLDSTGKSAIDGAAITVGIGGTLESTGGTLTIDPSSLDNRGELLATSGGTLVLDGITVTNAAGTVEADAASTLDLETATISGGTVAVDGLLDSTGASAIDGAVISIGASGILEVTSGTLTIDPGSINNSGLLEANGGTLEIDDTPVTNTGTLKATDKSTLVLNGETVTNGGTVQVDVGSTLDLETATVIGGIVAIFGLLVTTGTCAIDDAAITNTGTIEVSALSSLTIDPSTIINTGGTITVDGTLTLDGVILTGGTLDIDSGATLDLINTQIIGVDLSDLGTINIIGNSTIDGFSQVFGGLVTVASGQTLIVDNALLIGTVTNDGTVKVDSGSISEFAGKTSITGGNLINAGTINVDGTVTLTTVQVANTGAIVVGDSTVADTLTLTDSTVTGAGTITVADHATLTLNSATINGGTIDDTGTLSVIASSEIENATVNGGGNLTVTAGTLTLSGDTLDGVTLAGSFINGDTLTIDDTVTLNGATINGGIIDDTGTLSVSAPSEIENATVNGGNLTVAGGQTLTLSGDTLDGVTLAGSFTNADTLTIDDTVTLNGATLNGGIINNSGTIEVAAAGTIAGATLDSGAVTVGGGVTLTLDGDAVSGTVFTDTADGATLAVDPGASLTLSGVTIHGGALSIGSAGAVDVENGSTTLDGVSVTNDGTINVDAGAFSATLILDDDSKIAGGALTIGSSGLLDVEHGADGPNHGAVLDGVSVTDNGALDIGDLGSGAILTLDGGTTVLVNAMLTINAGSMLDVDGGITTISGSAIGTGGIITNNGIIEATSGGTLNIAANINNTSGMLEAKSGGLLDVQTTISGGSAIIMGGTLEFDASSSVNINFDNSNGYGELILGNPEHFSGQISGFSGTAPGAADSDQVELLNFTETSFSVRFIGGNQILTLHDAHGDVVTLTFDNFDGALDVSTSGGKTVIYDPPAEGAKVDSSTPATAVVDGHTAAPTTDTAQSIPVPAAGSLDAASSAAFAISTSADSGPSPAAPHNELSTGLSSSEDDHLVELSKIGGSQTFVAAVSPAEHGGDHVPGAVPNPPAVGDEHGHVTIATLDPPAISGEHVIDSLATGSPAGPSAEADVGSLPIENGSSAAFTQTALSSLLNVLTSDNAMLGSDHGAVSAVQTTLEGDHGNVSAIGTQSSFTSPALGADNFVFHPNLGDDTIHNASAHLTDVGSISGQNSPQPSGLAFSVPELVPEVMFDTAHHDAADLSTTVSQFQQMASSAHLLH